MSDVDACCPPIWMHANIHAHAPALAQHDMLYKMSCVLNLES